MTNQAIDILDGWRPQKVAPPPANLSVLDDYEERRRMYLDRGDA